MYMTNELSSSTPETIELMNSEGDLDLAVELNGTLYQPKVKEYIQVDGRPVFVLVADEARPFTPEPQPPQ